MSELKPDKEKDFFKRTLYNLKLYEKNHSRNPKKYCYEITILLNSLLGLLVIPKEKSMLNEIDINFLRYDGETKDFFRHMRNSITHGHFIDNIQVNQKTKEIAQITFIDKCPKCATETFRQVLTVDQLKTLVQKISEKYVKPQKIKCKGNKTYIIM